WGAVASGAALGRSVRERPQHCHCHCDCRGDPSIGAALAKQLEHCGPAPLPAAEAPASLRGLFFLGVLAGAAVALSVPVAFAQDLIRRGAVCPPAPSPPRAATSGSQAPARSGGEAPAGSAQRGKRGGGGSARAMAAAGTAAGAVVDRGSAAWVHYGAAEHHARLVSAHVENDKHAVAPPDHDVSVEQLSLNTADLEGIRYSATIDARLRGIPSRGSVLYTFAPLTASEISELLAEADQACNLERAQRGPPRLGEAARAPRGTAAAATPAPAASPGPSPSPFIGHDIGAERALPVGAAALGSRAPAVIDGAVASLEMLAEGADITRWALARSNFLCDVPRISARAPTERALVEAVGFMTARTRQVEGTPPSPLPGPPVGAEWIDPAIGSGIASLVARADKWRSDSPLRQRSSAAHARLRRERWLAVHSAAQEAVGGDLNLPFGRDPRELSAPPLRGGAGAVVGPRVNQLFRRPPKPEMSSAENTHGLEGSDADAPVSAATGGTHNGFYQRGVPAALSALFSFGAAEVDLAAEVDRVDKRLHERISAFEGEGFVMHGGRGVMEAKLASDEVGEMGRWNERWRYQRLSPSERAPRRRAPAADLGPLVGAATMDAVLWDLGVHGGASSELARQPRARFPEAPQSTIMGRDRRLRGRGRARAHFEDLFRARRQRRGRATDSHSELEANLLDYPDEVLADNAKLTRAEKTAHDLLCSTLPGKICDYPRLQRALKGCRKRFPPVSRMPLPIEVKSGMCALLIGDGERAAALCVETVFAGSFRPGQVLRAAVGDLVKPGISEKAWMHLLRHRVGVQGSGRHEDGPLGFCRWDRAQHLAKHRGFAGYPPGWKGANGTWLTRLTRWVGQPTYMWERLIKLRPTGMPILLPVAGSPRRVP
ncbi:unnamed protein product, partial [Prorocentrum cordatum]